MKEAIAKFVPLGISLLAAVFTYFGNRRVVKISSEYKLMEKNVALLSEKQMAILEVIPKIHSNYYKNLNRYNENNKMYNYYNELIEVEKKLFLSLIDTRVYSEQDIIKSINPVIFYNLEIMKNTTSKEVVSLLTWYTQSVYNKKNSDLMLAYNSLLYKYLIFDFKKITIDDDALLKLQTTDFNEQKNFKGNFRKIRKESGIK